MEKPVLIDLNDYERTGEGANGASYICKADPELMVKLYNPDYPTDTIFTELDVARKVYGLEIPSPEPGKLVTDGDRIGISFRNIRNKRSYARAISQEPSRVDEYSREFARFCKKLHSVVCPDGLFPDAKPQFRTLVEAEKGFTEEQKKPIYEFLESIPDCRTALHGDMHIGNALTTLTKGAAMEDEHQVYFIDLGYFCSGYPLLDIGMLQNVCLYADEAFRVENFHINGEIMAKVWESFVNEYFFGPEKLGEKYFGAGTDAETVNERMQPYTALKYFLVSFNLGFMPQNYDEMVRRIFKID